MAYGYVHLPKEFTTLLQSNMQASGHGFAILKKVYWRRHHFQSVALRATEDLGNHLSFDQLINTLGWLGLRDRLAAHFLNHQRYGHFVRSHTLECLEDILDFEDKVKDYSLNGYGRAFLFGFYLKMGHFEEQTLQGKIPQARNKLISDDIIDVLRLVKSRTIEIDWLCLSLHYLIKFTGKEKVIKLIKSGGGLSALRKDLTVQQEFTMMKAFLAYGASINDQEAFYNPTV